MAPRASGHNLYVCKMFSKFYCWSLLEEKIKTTIALFCGKLVSFCLWYYYATLWLTWNEVDTLLLFLSGGSTARTRSKITQHLTSQFSRPNRNEIPQIKRRQLSTAVTRFVSVAAPCGKILLEQEISVYLLYAYYMLVFDESTKDNSFEK